jgi:hypothetical protein
MAGCAPAQLSEAKFMVSIRLDHAESCCVEELELGY